MISLRALVAMALMLVATQSEAKVVDKGTESSLPGTIGTNTGGLQPTCEGLTGLTLPHATITSATTVLAGTLTIPTTNPPTTLPKLPKFCRVIGVSKPTADSNINLEVWIPIGSYNGRYEQVGNGGFAGVINYVGLAQGLRHGFATASTDDGATPQGPNGEPLFALGHPERIVDYGYRALKETTDKSKAIIAAFTGKPPSHSYFHGCSDGGREALMEAQRYPNDFDGIIAGAPANYFTHQFAGFVFDAQTMYPPNSLTPNVPPELMPVLSHAVLQQCAGKDGGLATDFYLTNPPACKPNLPALKCQSGQDPATCLSQAQIDTVQRIYDGPNPPHTQQSVYPGFEPGTEWELFNWPAWITGSNAAVSLQARFGYSFFAYFLQQSPAWDFHTLNFTTDIALADQQFGQILNAIDPNLEPFMAHGGKIIEYSGWGDSAVAPRNTINYYQSVASFMSQQAAQQNKTFKISDHYRLFMAPGVEHCFGGPGANAFGNILEAPVPDSDHDVLAAIVQWVEQDVAPAQIIATKYANDTPPNVEFQRPLCPYPASAHYKGGGADVTNANSYRCISPSRPAPGKSPYILQ